MRLTIIVPTAVLVTSAVATPVINRHGSSLMHSRRQIGGLESVLQLVKGLLNDKDESDSIDNDSSSDAAVTATYTKADNCADAIQKIDNVLGMSASFMNATGGEPTLRDINAVLSSLEDSLSQCADDGNIDVQDDRRRAEKRCFPSTSGFIEGATSVGDENENEAEGADNSVDETLCHAHSGHPDLVHMSHCADDDCGDNHKDRTEKRGMESVGGVIGGATSADDEGSGSPLGDISTNNYGGDETKGDNDMSSSREDGTISRNTASSKKQSTRSRMLTARTEQCSDCERELYAIVKELQQIFSMGNNAGNINGPNTVNGTQSPVTQADNDTSGQRMAQDMRLAQIIRPQAERVKAADNGTAAHSMS